MTHDEKIVRDADIIERTRQGQSVNEITAATGWKYGVIYRVLQSAGVEPVKKYRRRSTRSVPKVTIEPRRKHRKATRQSK